MKVLDFYPTKGFFRPGEKPIFRIKTDMPSGQIETRMDIFKMGEQIMSLAAETAVNGGTADAEILEMNEIGGYVARLSVGEVQLLTAFDVQNSWTDFPRYGYVSDFTPGKRDTQTQIEAMVKYHVNGVQFYDWQYRHDTLLSKERLYRDPFNREMSLDTVQEWIRTCHKYGMAAMPYLAIYAASVDFWETHQAWGMFDKNGQPLMFEDFLGLVDPTRGSDWFTHLDKECDRVLERTDFDGLHIDQYGEPKVAFNSCGEPINLPTAFVEFINHQKDKNKGTVVFNAVGDWPSAEIAKSKADFMYIEVWDFTPAFKDLMDIVINTREQSGGRAVVIPIYIKQKDFHNVLLADAVIAASGGSHLEIGDGKKLLSDPYFPKAEHITDVQRQILRKYWDFIVGYQDLNGPKTQNADVDVETNADVMTICRQSDKCVAINVINCSGSDKWTETIAEVTVLSDVSVNLRCDMNIKSVTTASPDKSNIMTVPLEYTKSGDVLTVTLSKLKYWSVIIIEER